MAPVKIRNLGQVGMVTDVASYELPMMAFEDARNVRFVNGKIQRAPIHRTLHNLGTTYDYQHLASMSEFDAGEKTLIFTSDERAYSFSNGTLTDISISGYSHSVINGYWTTCKQSGVMYANNIYGKPMYISSGMPRFVTLANWQSTDKCRVIRGYKDFVVTMNITKGSSEYPTMVKWGNAVTYGNIPSTWDTTDTSALAGENVISDTNTEIIDGLTLRDDFIIYCDRSVYKMQYVGTPYLFSFMKIYDDEGIIAANCVAEVAGLHYVFGKADLYQFDGTARKSIAAGRVRDKIFERINRSSLDSCFVASDIVNKQIYFCYNTAADEIKYTSADKCNEAAVYNYVSDTWAFVDLANVVSASFGTLQKGKLFSDSEIGALTYDQFAGTYMSTEGQANDITMFLHKTSTDHSLAEYKLTGLDFIQDGLVTYNYEAPFETTPYVQKSNIDMDELFDLEGRKLIKSIAPQSLVKNRDAGQLYFTFGSHEYPSDEVVFGTQNSFNSSIQYKLDTRINGRYLSFKMQTDNRVDFEVSGFDLDVQAMGRR